MEISVRAGEPSNSMTAPGCGMLAWRDAALQ
jgi:hypothetical protein